MHGETYFEEEKSSSRGRFGGLEMEAEIWDDRWQPVKHSPRIVSPWVDMLAESKVSNLIDQDRCCWNREAIEATLLPFEAEIVQKNSPMQY